MKFELDKDEIEVARKFKKKRLKKDSTDSGAIGGRFTYCFTPTSLGMIATIVDELTGKKKTLTDFDKF